jgi:thioredoxin reductase (NADPH)
MSDYLFRSLGELDNVTVCHRTQVVDGHGPAQLDELTLADSGDAARERVPADALFLLIGASPRTEWLSEAIARDEHGYVLTGRDVSTGAVPGHDWASRVPVLAETSLRGVFAAGDVRHGSIKRVAAAVGEGATAVRVAHEFLAELKR